MTRLAEENKIDILFTDIVMPGTINGWELADQARANNAALRVLFTSGYALEALTTHNRLPEGAIFLSKPYRKTELAKRLLETLPS